MRHKYIINILLLMTAFNAFAAEDKIWDTKVPSAVLPNGWNSLEQLCFDVERISSEIDQEGKGIRIIYYKDIPLWTNETFKISASNGCTLKDLLELPFSSSEYSVIFADDVAIAGMKARRTVNVFFKGRCSDVYSQKSVTNISLKWNSTEGTLNIETNGSYWCIMPVNINYYVNSEIIFASSQFLNSNIYICVESPGYYKGFYPVSVFMPGDQKEQIININLVPIIKGSVL